MALSSFHIINVFAVLAAREVALSIAFRCCVC